MFDPKIQNPYTVNVYLGVQHSLTSTMVLETAFVGNRGIKYPLHRVFNQVDRVSGVRPNLDLGEGYMSIIRKARYTRHGSRLCGSALLRDSQRALTTRGARLWQRRTEIGGYYQGIADVRVQDFFNLRAERGPADGDTTHFFAADAVYDLPALASSPGLVKHTLGGWQASGIFTAATGQPLLILQGGARETSRPDYVGGNPITSDYQETLQYLNPAAFAKIPISSASGRTIRPGNLGSGAVRGPGFWNADFSLGKTSRLRSKRGFRFAWMRSTSSTIQT